MVQYISQRAFQDYRYGLAAASVVLFGVVFILTTAQWLYARSREAA